MGLLGAGRLKALLARVKSDPAVDTEVAPPSLSKAVSGWWMQALRRMPLGDNRIRACAMEARGDQSADVERGGSVMQPMIVLVTPR